MDNVKTDFEAAYLKEALENEKRKQSIDYLKWENHQLAEHNRLWSEKYNGLEIENAHLKSEIILLRKRISESANGIKDLDIGGEIV